jgi:hypothetical protein
MLRLPASRRNFYGQASFDTKPRRLFMQSPSSDPELDFVGGFALLAGGIWLLGAVTLIVMVMLGQGRV